MRKVCFAWSLMLIGGMSAGCAATPASLAVTARHAWTAPIEPLLAREPAAAPRASLPKDGGVTDMGLPALVQLAVDLHPRLAQATWAIEAARGRALQAGLYPNPTLSVSGNEISDRTGPAGIWSVYAGQEMVTGNKLKLSQAAAWRDVDQATLRLVAERFEVITQVRQAFFEALTLQRRAEILAELVALAEQSVANSKKLLQAKEAAELDVVQLEVDLERYRAELEATQRALPEALRRLVAAVGSQELRLGRLLGDLNAPMPGFEFDSARALVLSVHPDLRVAELAAQRAEILLQRAQVEPVPNVTVGAGYTYQGQNRSHDWDVGVSVPVPLWNRNQGDILAARALVGATQAQIDQARVTLIERLATAFTTYSAARRRAERYQSSILPKATRTFELSRQAYQGGQFEYLRVLEAQRALAEARLELIRSQGEMWQAASSIAGLMLEESWPTSMSTSPEKPAP